MSNGGLLLVILQHLLRQKEEGRVGDLVLKKTFDMPQVGKRPPKSILINSTNKRVRAQYRHLYCDLASYQHFASSALKLATQISSTFYAFIFLCFHFLLLSSLFAFISICFHLLLLLSPFAFIFFCFHLLLLSSPSHTSSSSSSSPSSSSAFIFCFHLFVFLSCCAFIFLCFYHLLSYSFAFLFFCFHLPLH